MKIPTKVKKFFFKKKCFVLMLIYFVLAPDNHIEYSTWIMVEHTCSLFWNDFDKCKANKKSSK